MVEAWDTPDGVRLPRRDFLKASALAGTAGVFGSAMAAPSLAHAHDPGAAHVPGQAFGGVHLDRIAFPLGGLGAGMVCLEGSGMLSQLSVRNRPDLFSEPMMFAALTIRGRTPVVRVLEGPVPRWKTQGGPGDGQGAVGASYGLPRCQRARSAARFPFATVDLEDDELPLRVRLTGWSPFTPGDADDSSLPLAALEYRFTNPGSSPVDAVFSYNARNVMDLPQNEAMPGRIGALSDGLTCFGRGRRGEPWDDGWFALACDAPELKVNRDWFRGGWWDGFTLAWRDIEHGNVRESPPPSDGDPSPGGTLAVPFSLAPGECRTIVVRLCWYVPASNLMYGLDPEGVPANTRTHVPWYAKRYDGIEPLARDWAQRYDDLHTRSAAFADCFHDTSLPAVAHEAIAANLSILKSPTILRQTDGGLWMWEGSIDAAGLGPGTCSHVWNYAQAIAHLFPALERGVRETEFGDAQDDSGHQVFRVSLPIRAMRHDEIAASDGQLGGLIRLHREWRIGGDTAWLRTLWPKARASLDYCIRTWDPRATGTLEEPHHNTYDIEFWGADGMCTSIYLGASKAMQAMGAALGEDVVRYADLYRRGRATMESRLYVDGRYIQRTRWKDLDDADPRNKNHFQAGYSAEAIALSDTEGPKYQYGNGCLSDGVIGAWFANVCGVGEILDPRQVDSHLRAVHRHNLKRDLSRHANTQRPGFAFGDEGGLLLCTWPDGGKPSLPFPYSDELWTGIEHQVASHLAMTGALKEALDVVWVSRTRYDGSVRNPFNEYEYGYWYGRALRRSRQNPAPRTCRAG